MRRRDALQDSKPGAASQPGPTPEATELLGLGFRVLEAKGACDTHQPPHAGPEWAAKTQAFRDAWAAWEAAILRLRGGDR